MSQKLISIFNLNILLAFILFFPIFPIRATTVTRSSLSAVPVKLLFETSVEKPSHLALCNNSLWTFSEHNQLLISIDTQSGKQIREYPIDSTVSMEKPVDIAAITCQNNRLFLLINSKKYARIFEVQTKEETIKITSQAVLPQKARATDLICSLKKCWLLQEKIFETVDMQTWVDVKIPPPESLKKSNARPDLDPFEDWQAPLILAKNKYIKGAVNDKEMVVFLDPFRTQMVFQKNSEWLKWGSFGVWEGYFLSPKAITYVSENTLAIADAKLKTISLFTQSGQFLGVLTWNSEILYSPEYPIGLASDKNRLYVADFSANKIVALEVKQFKSDVENSDTLRIRKNLFRRTEVLKDSPSSLCMNCHDGTVSNQLHKYIKMHFHHPLECSQCHDPHHTSKEPHFLLKPEQRLCQSCHKEFAEPKTNHVWTTHNKKGGHCTDCHRPHSDT